MGDSEPAEGGLVLVVEDKEANRMVLKRALKAQGHRTVEAEGGHQALRVLEEHRDPPIDVVLLDLLMPDMDGYETLSRIRQDQRFRDLPVIVINSSDEVSDTKRYIELGASGYLTKPVNPTLLKASVGALLAERRLRDTDRQLRGVARVAAEPRPDEVNPAVGSEGAAAAVSLAPGREAVKRREWSRVYSLLSEADETSELAPHDLEALGEAAIATAHYDDTRRLHERAYAGYKAQGEPQAAARMAIWLASEHYVRSRPAVARGWQANAERIIADEAEGASHGLMAWLRGQVALVADNDPEAASHLSEEATAVGRRLGDTDVEMLGLATGGRALVLQGKVEEGLAQMDTAMATALTGELSPYVTRIVFCHLLCGCNELGDYQRAGEWSDAAEECSARQAIVTSAGDCRVHKAALLRWRGEWADAEAEARRGSEQLGGEALHGGLAFYELGEVRLRRGDLSRAGEAFRSAQDCGHSAQPGRALLALAQGKTGTAASMIRAELEDARVPLTRATLLPAQIEIALAMEDLETARSAAQELSAIAASYRTPVLEAASASADGAIELAANDPSASAHLRRALRGWHKMGAPYEGAKVRVLLAQAHLALGDAYSAASELKAAGETLEKLGAVPDARRVGQLLRDIEVSTEHTRRTLMFTDIVKSTPLIEAIGDEAWADLQRWHDATLRSIFAAHQGEEVRDGGDGFFIAFDSREHALDCAIVIQRALAEHRRTHGFAPQVRIGVHAGDVMRKATGYSGKDVHVAARIGALAEGGEILVSRETIPEDATLVVHEPRTVELKGVADPVEVVTIAWK